MTENLERDVVVVGGGGAGLTAALTAAVHGARVTLVEAAEGIGGTTLFSGGQVWVPNNHHLSQVGAVDSREDALSYLRSTMPGRNDEERWAAFVDGAPEMLRFVEQHTVIRFKANLYPDTFAEAPGGRIFGRNVEVEPVPTRLLGKWRSAIPELPKAFRVPVPLTYGEVMRFMHGRRPYLAYPSILFRLLSGRATMSRGLVAGLLHSCLRHGVEVLLKTRASELLMDGARVTGLRAFATQQTLSIRAKKGVILAAGSFDWNRRLVDEFLPAPLEHPVAPPCNRGDAIDMARKVGARLAHMDEAWYWPALYTGLIYKGAALGRILLNMKTYPHSIVVNREGQRFVNEAAHNMALSLMYDKDEVTGKPRNQPAWAIFDNQFRSKYSEFSVGLTPSTAQPPWLLADRTLRGLANKIGVDPDGLTATVARFNAHAKQDMDPDFHRGEFTYDRFYGDASAANPCLGALESPPYYAARVYASSVGTKGGVMTNAHWQALTDSNDVMPGLYAAGNCSAAIIGPVTIAGAATLGSGLTAGFIAGRHSATS